MKDYQKCYDNGREGAKKEIMRLLPERTDLWSDCRKVCARDGGKCVRANDIKCDDSENTDQCYQRWVEANAQCVPKFINCAEICAQ